MTVDDREFTRLETIVEVVREEFSRHQSDLKQLLGAIKELSGKVMVLSDDDQIQEQFRQVQSRFSELNEQSNRQARDIGQLYGAIHALASAVANNSKDAALARAVKGITINVSGAKMENRTQIDGDVDRLTSIDGDGNSVG